MSHCRILSVDQIATHTSLAIHTSPGDVAG